MNNWNGFDWIADLLTMHIAACEVSDDTTKTAELEHAIEVLKKSRRDVKLTKEVCRHLKWFLTNKKIDRLDLEITDVAAYEENGQIIVNITLAKPGKLIGKGGKTIDALIEYLTDNLYAAVKLQKVKINITESKLWN